VAYGEFVSSLRLMWKNGRMVTRNVYATSRSLMEPQQARRQIARDFPDLRVEEIRYLGEGFGNTAFEVNRQFVFRFAKTPLHREELKRELPILQLVAAYSPLPTPQPEFITADHSYVGYRKLPGNQLIDERTAFSDWRGLARQIGEFMAAMNSIPSELVTTFTPNEETSLAAYLANAQSDYERVASVIPRQLRPAIEEFLSGSAPPHLATGVLPQRSGHRAHISGR
jgi:hypothetical protein